MKDGMTTSSPGPMSREHCRHLEGRGARVREQSLLTPDALLEPTVAPLGERPAT